MKGFSRNLLETTPLLYAAIVGLGASDFSLRDIWKCPAFMCTLVCTGTCVEAENGERVLRAHFHLLHCFHRDGTPEQR